MLTLHPRPKNAGRRKRQATDGTLRITGERKFEKEEKGRRYHRIERSYGTSERSFFLPEGAKTDKLKAEFKDGLLQIHLPKAPEIQAKAIEVPVS